MARPIRTVILALFVLVAAAPGAAAAGRDPVLLVHGYRGSPGTWADMKAYLEKQGRTVHAIDLASENNVTNANAIRAKLKELKWRTVDIVGQSMGGLSARWFAKSIDSGVRVDAYVSLGSPHYGIWSACALPTSYGGQMCPTSGFLSDLNAGDDTPGTTDWTTIYSTGDEYVPTNSSRLDGGACFVQFEGIGHNAMDNDPGIMAATLAGIDGRCTGTFRD
jgi:triacylglycerol lipase